MKHFYIFILLTLNVFLGVAQVTPPEDLQDYYTTVDFTKTGLELKTDLSSVTISKHTKSLTYSQVWSALKVTDLDPANANNVLLVYGFDDTDGNLSTDRSRNKNNNGGNNGDWNREHIYPKSLGTPNLGEDGPGADAQMLRPSDVGRNADRNNLKYADGAGHSDFSNNGWYPGDEWKGDCARIIMYMYLRYGDRCLPSNVGFGTAEATPDDMIDLFLEWNVEDPVSDFERTRNTYHANTSNTYAQGNRNPFIDNPYLATAIWGGPEAENTWDNHPNDDTEAPTIPINLAASNIQANSFTLNWTASTDNVAVASYSINIDDDFFNFAYTNSITIQDLTPSTTYTVSIYAIDTSGNYSEESESITVTTTEASNEAYCTEETFSNIGASESNYATRVWTGDNTMDWRATEARTDQNMNGSRVIAIRDGILTPPRTSGGIGQLTVTTQRVFSGTAGTFDLVINGTKVGEIPYGDAMQTTTIENLNIEGVIQIEINNNSTASNRVMFDDLRWTCFDALSVEDNDLSEIQIFPNPFNNTLQIQGNNLKETQVNVYNLLGKLVLSTTLQDSRTLNTHALQPGLYILKLKQGATVLTKKIIKH